jgi:hypothetical protein
MDQQYTDVIAVFDIGRTWKRFDLFDRGLHPLSTSEKIIPETVDSEGYPCEDLPAVQSWIRSCINGVTGGALYSIRAVSIAGTEECLQSLESAVSDMLKAGITENSTGKCISINSTAASLIPYLRGSDKPFILVSTGTWCTFMNPFEAGSSAGGQEETGIRGVKAVGEQQVKYARFHLGEIHDRNVTMLDDHFGVTGELYKTIKIKNKKIEKIRANRRGRVFFRHGIPEGYADTTADLSHFLTYADAYHQMMYDLVDECLISFRDVITEDDTTEIIYVTGGFALNDTFVRILAARIPDKRVYASTIEYATALGAAIEAYPEIFGTELPPLYLGLKAILLRDD